MGYSIAIDGPAGAGKSTVAKLVAQKLQFVYVDTGAMYRAMALYFLTENLVPEDTPKTRAACHRADIRVAYEQGVQQMYVRGENVTGRLRTEEVGNMASKIAAIPEVRECLLQLQRTLAKTHNVVMDGRDIGTHILPEADVKIYLTADVEVRARRRFEELQAKGEVCDFQKIAADIRRRDRQDMEREIAPLRQAEDAIYLDSSGQTPREVAEQICRHCQPIQAAAQTETTEA